MNDFSSYLGRRAAENDLKKRAKISSLQQWLSQAPELRNLKQKASTRDRNTTLGIKISGNNLIKCISELPEDIDFLWLTSLAMKRHESQEIRAAKIKTSLPFIISLENTDEYEITKARVIGGDCIVISAHESHESIVANQLAIEMARELGLESILECKNDEELLSNINRDCDWFLLPSSLAITHKELLKNRSIVVTSFHEYDLQDLTQQENLALIINDLDH